MVILPPCVPFQCGKEWRNSLKKSSNTYKIKSKRPRIVPAFTIQALQKNTRVLGPPKGHVFKEVIYEITPLRKQYQQENLPVTIDFGAAGKRLIWKYYYVPVERLDTCYYLPLFLYGLVERDYPFSFIVENGIRELVQGGQKKLLRCIPQIMYDDWQSYM